VPSTYYFCPILTEIENLRTDFSKNSKYRAAKRELYTHISRCRIVQLVLWYATIMTCSCKLVVWPFSWYVSSCTAVKKYCCEIVVMSVQLVLWCTTIEKCFYKIVFSSHHCFYSTHCRSEASLDMGKLLLLVSCPPLFDMRMWRVVGEWVSEWGILCRDYDVLRCREGWCWNYI
jgi:hypothetical protein